MNLFLPFLALIAPLSLIQQINGQSFDLIKQYYECKHLKMIVKSDWKGTYYARDESISGNKLNDTFFQNLGLTKMTFDQGMNFIKKIYTDTNKCYTLFCNCTSWSFIESFNTTNNNYNVKSYKIYFRNESNFAGIKDILLRFYKEYQANLFDSNNQNDLSYEYLDKEYPTISKFLMRFDYTPSKGFYFKKFPNYLESSTQWCYYNGYYDFYKVIYV